MEDALGHLSGFFGAVAASEITRDRIASYISWRQEQGAAAGTINRELAALTRAFRLAQKAGKVAFRPEISTLSEERQPREFFEADQYLAVLENLPEYLKPDPDGLHHRVAHQVGDSDPPDGAPRLSIRFP